MSRKYHGTEHFFLLSIGENSSAVSTPRDVMDVTEHPHDDKSRPHVCTVCEKRFTKKSNLNEHKFLHTRETLFECHQCKRYFASYAYLRKHMNVHSSKFKCTECGKCCQTNHMLTVHRRSHLERNRLNVLFVANDLRYLLPLFSTAEFTVDRNHTNVTCVTRCLVGLHNYSITWESTRETNRTSVHCVTKVSRIPSICRLTQVIYTATEDLMTVVTVGSCLKLVKIWGVMFVFTLVQSRTHVDTVQTVFLGLTNSRHICWSHTMKVLGSHVTFVRRNSPGVVILRYMCVVMKVWSRIFAVNVQVVSVQQVNWSFTSISTGVKELGCGLCGKAFTWKQYVVRHFERCAQKF